MAEPVVLKPAVSLAKEQCLALLDEARREVEADQCLSLVIIPMFGGKRFHIRSAGEVSMLKLAGIIGRAWMDATNALND